MINSAHHRIAGNTHTGLQVAFLVLAMVGIPLLLLLLPLLPLSLRFIGGVPWAGVTMPTSMMTRREPKVVNEMDCMHLVGVTLWKGTLPHSLHSGNA